MNFSKIRNRFATKPRKTVFLLKFKRTYNKKLETYDSELKNVFDNLRIEKIKKSDILKNDKEFINSIESIDRLNLEDISILKNSDIGFAISKNNENYSKDDT